MGGKKKKWENTSIGYGGVFLKNGIIKLEEKNMKDIIEDVTILYRDGSKKLFEAISVKKHGIYTGYIKHSNGIKVKFVNQIFIPKIKIKKITICKGDGRLKEIIF